MTKKTEHFSIQNAELEGRVVTLKAENTKPEFVGRKYLCTGGNGCSPTALGTKIFLRDIVTGESVGYTRRESIATVEPAFDVSPGIEWTPVMIPACLSTGMRHTKSGHPELVGLSFEGVKNTIWVHQDTLGQAAEYLTSLHKSVQREKEEAKRAGLAEAQAKLKAALATDDGKQDTDFEAITQAAHDILTALEGK